MKSHCHSCGREYLTARALAGQAIACRSCGALNDGAGGPPPAQGEPKRRAESERRDPATGSRGARSGGEQRIKSGAAFTIGSTPKPADPAKLAEIEVGAMREKLAVAESAQGWRGSRVVFALGIGAASVTALVTAGIFIYRAMVMPEAGIDWAPMQRAVAGIDTPLGDGSAFVVESKGDLWLVTSFEVIGAAPEVTATFRDPTTGAEVLRLPGLRSKDVWVSKRFFGRATGLPSTGDDASSDDASSDGAVSDESVEDGAPHFTIAAANIEMYRPQIEALGIAPLALASGGDVRAGVDVVAMGHTIARNDDGVQQGAAAHALFDGTVSARKNPTSGPAYLQTSAQFEEGCAGGPLFLKSTQEVAGVQLDPWLTADRRLVLLADEIADVTENGVQLGALRKTVDAAALRQTGTAEGVKEAVEWPLFPEFEAEIIALEAEGWRIRAQEIVVTGADGLAVLTHAVTSPPNAQVALAVLSREAVVPIEIGPFESAAGSMTAHRVGGDAWSSSIVVATDASRSTFVSIPAATRVAVTIRTTFLGQPIRGRVVYVFLERDPSTAPTSVPQGNPQGNSSTPSPGVPAVPNPSQPPAPPPTAPPSQPAPAPQSLPLPAGSTVASVVELHDNMAKAVYASSLIGLRDFDQRYLTSLNPVETWNLLERDFVDACAFVTKDDPELFREIMAASLEHSLTMPVANGITLSASRPSFEAILKKVPLGTQVGIYLDVDPSMRRYLALPSDGLISQSADVKIDTAGQSTAYRYVAEADLFRIPLWLPWNDEELRRLEQAIEIPYSIVARYNDGSEDRFTGRVRVNPVAQVERAYPFGLGFAALVDETHPWVKRVIDEINQRADVKRAGVMLAGGGGDGESKLQSIALFWQDLAARGLRYQNLTAADGEAQRCRLVHESLGSANANCIDGTVLLASFLEAVGIEAYIVIVPGHAFLIANLDELGFIEIETTMIGDSVPRDPVTAHDELFRDLRASSALFRTSAINTLENACGEGLLKVNYHIQTAKPVLEKYRQMNAEYDRRKDDPEWMREYHAALSELSNQIKIVPVSLARKNGVRPVGAPTNLDQRFGLPPRR